MNMKRILVLLSTYNGEQFLHQQIDSILSQKGVKIHLLIRDDGSSDKTTDIVNEYVSRHTDDITFIKGDNIGCRNSFYSLVKSAKDFQNFDYYAFSDQDDVWLPDKLVSAAEILDKGVRKLRLYHSLPMITDTDLNPKGATLPPSRSTLGEAFILQPCLGCTMVFNREVLEYASMVTPDVTSLHDAWIYRMALAMDGFVYEDPVAHILYRQHSSNVIGGSQSFIKRWQRRFKTYMNSDNKRSNDARKLLSCYRDYIPQNHRQTLELLSNYSSSFKSKIKILKSKEFRSNSLIHNTLFSLAILFNKI